MPGLVIDLTYRGNNTHEAAHKANGQKFFNSRVHQKMTLTAAMVNDFTLPDNGPGSIPSLQHWMQGFALQTLVYGINIVLFFMAIWVLAIHILKASHTHKFHRLHLLQNYTLMVYTMVMFALSSVYMGRQGLMADGAWHSVFRDEGVEGVVENIFSSKAAPRRVCNAALVLINWGTVGILVRVLYVFYLY
jgi:hypothetical protein